MVGICFFPGVFAIAVVMITLHLLPEKETAVVVGTAIGSIIVIAIGTVISSLLQEH